MRTTKRDEVLKYMEVVHVSTASKLHEHVGVSGAYLDEIARGGGITRLGRGIYALPDAEPSIHRSLVEVAAAVPDAVITLTSALSFHGIGTQLPWAVWTAVPRQSRSYVPTRLGTPTQVVRMDERLINDGVEEHVFEGVAVRIHSVEKAIADCFKYSSRVSLNVALEALKDAWDGGRVDMDRLYEYARRDRVWNKMKPYVEMTQQ